MRERNWTGKSPRSETVYVEALAHTVTAPTPFNKLLLSRFHIPVCLFQCGSISKYTQIRTSDLLAHVIRYA